MPLSWDFTARWFASFAGADQRLPEQGRTSGLDINDYAAERLIPVR
jgi:hypothetical protein